MDCRGIVLITVVMILFLMTAGVAAGFCFLTLSIRIVEAEVEATKTLHLAEAGMEHARALLCACQGEDGCIKPLTAFSGSVEGLVEASCPELFRLAVGDYCFILLDNEDGDGDPFRDRDGNIFVAARGTAGGSSSCVLQAEFSAVDRELKHWCRIR